MKPAGSCDKIFSKRTEHNWLGNMRKAYQKVNISVGSVLKNERFISDLNLFARVRYF